jgi:hypothetical protein
MPRMPISPPTNAANPAMFATVSTNMQETLVAQIKELQRQDPAAKEQWIAFTDQSGGGTRDPMKHTPEFLEGFLAQWHSGTKLIIQDDSKSLVDVVKVMQKRSGGFKNIWANFCAQFGAGKNDPAKHDGPYLLRFFEYLASTSMGSNCNPMAPMPFVAGPMENPMKRMRDSGGCGMSTGMDSEKEALVMSVKAYQRQGAQQKEIWGSYADQFLGGVRDPSRHDESTLQDFINNHGVAKVSASGGAGAGAASINWGSNGTGAGMGNGMTTFGANPGMMANKAVEMDMDPARQALVQRVKAYQKQSPDQRDIWYGFCGATRDPARHPAEKLQEFINVYSIP